MGTEFSRRVNAWIAVSGWRGIRGYLVLAPIAQCGKWRRREGLERKGDGKMQRRSGRSAVSRARLQLRFVLRGIKSMGTACSQTAISPAARGGERTHLVVQLSETLHRFPRDLISSSSFSRAREARKEGKERVAR